MRDPSEALGAISALQGDVITGWAFDPGEPDLCLAIEIYLNGAFVALVRADLEEEQPGHGDGFHGFAHQIYSGWFDKAHTIAARVANHGPWLAGTIQLPKKTVRQVSSPLPSQVSYVGGLQVSGWVFDPEKPGEVITVCAREGETALAACKADRPQPNLVYALSTNHGFALSLPWSLADGELHEVHIETEEGKALLGSPIKVCCTPAGMRGLLHRIEPAPQDQQKKALLAAMLGRHELLYPSSCGFEFYPEWLDAFDPAPPGLVNSPMPPDGHITIFLFGSGDEKAKQKSMASIEGQRVDPQWIEVLDASAAGAMQNLTEQLEGCCLLVPLEIGDTLAPHALDVLLSAAQLNEAWIVYGDCDQISEQGRPCNPWLKPAWDPTLHRAIDLITAGGSLTARAIRMLLAEVPSSITQSAVAAPSAWHALLECVVLRCENRVLHIPHVLYHRSALQESRPIRKVVAWAPPARLPSVSLIVPTRDQLALLKPCVEGLLKGTDYPDLEIIVVDNQSTEEETLQYLAALRTRGVRVLSYPHPFNYAAMNNWAVQEARGELIGLINNDVSVIEPDWLKTMVAHIAEPRVAIVGAKLLWPNGMVQHGGVVVGIAGLAAHSLADLYQDDPGYLGLNLVAREQSAVTAACLLIRKADFLGVRGFDAAHFPVAFNDVDLCLRIRAQGKRIVWTPHARLFHAESASRGIDDTPQKAARAQREARLFIERWHAYLHADPFYHPFLAYDLVGQLYGALSLAPRQAEPRSNTTPFTCT
jgi:GT2 family glycosyltransferase